MLLRKLTAADRYDTWEADWKTRLLAHLQSTGYDDMWDFVRRSPGETYGELAERLCAAGGFGVAPVQIERLQAQTTPERDLAASIRDSLARHLRHAFVGVHRWGDGPYWESRAIGALASWTAMWSPRIDLGPLRHRLFELGAPGGWLPENERDPFLLALVADHP